MNTQNWQLQEGDPFSAVATNSLGWEVQELQGKAGWVAVCTPFIHKKHATLHLLEVAEAARHSPSREFRVYEALKPR